MKFMKEFKEFISKGNVMDLAVGVIIGGAFGKIVASLVNDVIMPVVGLILGGKSVSSLSIILKEAPEAENNLVLNYGMFLQNILDFVIIALVIFMMIKALNKFKRKEEAAPAAPAEPPEEVLLLREIRDNLKK